MLAAYEGALPKGEFYRNLPSGGGDVNEQDLFSVCNVSDGSAIIYQKKKKKKKSH